MERPRVRRAIEGEDIEKATFIYRSAGPTMEHNYLCAICKLKSAVQDCNTGVLQPCWDCQKTYKVVKLNWLDRLLGRDK